MLKNVKILWASWAVVHAVLLSLVFATGTTNGDLYYYFRGMNPEITSGSADPATKMATESGALPLSEYPHAGIWPLHLIDGIAGNNQDLFLRAFSVMCVILSGIFLCFLLRWGRDHKKAGRSPIGAGWFWVLFCAAAGPILLTRLDIVPGMLVAMSIAWMATRPRVASFLLAFATLSKLWPGVIAAAFVDRFTARGTWQRLVAFAVSLVALAAVTVAMVDFNRLVSPITYQDVRGLQVESIMATPFMTARIFEDSQWVTDYASSKSYEILGPGVSLAVQAADALLLVTVAFALGFALWRFLKGGWTQETASLFALLLILMLIVTNKVFSPQYVVWIGPTIAVVSLLSTYSLRKLQIGMIIAAVFTVLIYPVTYEALLHTNDTWPLLYLIVRNVLIIAITIYVGYCLYRACRDAAAAQEHDARPATIRSAESTPDSPHSTGSHPSATATN